jgi:hypothetical protein
MNKTEERIKVANSIGLVIGNADSVKDAFCFGDRTSSIYDVLNKALNNLNKVNTENGYNFVDPLNNVNFVKYFKSENIIEIHLSLWYAIHVKTKLKYREIKLLIADWLAAVIPIYEDTIIDLHENIINEAADKLKNPKMSISEMNQYFGKKGEDY